MSLSTVICVTVTHTILSHITITLSHCPHAPTGASAAPVLRPLWPLPSDDRNRVTALSSHDRYRPRQYSGEVSWCLPEPPFGRHLWRVGGGGGEVCRGRGATQATADWQQQGRVTLWSVCCLLGGVTFSLSKWVEREKKGMGECWSGGATFSWRFSRVRL